LKNLFTILLFPLIILLLLSGCSKKVDDTILLAAHIAIVNGAIIIDVRTKKEYKLHHIPNAINISVEELSESVARVPKNRVLVVYCQSGSRSSIAAEILSQKGWKVYDIATQSEYNREILAIQDLIDRGSGYLVQGQRDNAIKSFKESCDGGDAKGCLHLGALYLSSNPRELSKALDAYKNSCEAASIGCRQYEYTVKELGKKGH